MTSDLLLERLMSEYSDCVFRTCFVYLNDYQLAEDAAQETFINALRSYDSFRKNASEKTWITRIAINCSKNIRRTKWFRYCRNELSEFIHPDRTAFSDAVIEKNGVLNAVSKLKALDREVIFLYYYQELPVDEIAEITGKSVNAVTQRLYRARNRLKVFLEEAGYGR